MHASKIIEVRDRMTFIPALAVLIRGTRDTQEGKLLRRAGYGNSEFYVVLHHLQTGETRNDPNCWNNSRTMPAAHRWLLANWDGIPDGGLIDVRVVLGEEAEPCASEIV